jgi:glycerol kinase
LPYWDRSAAGLWAGLSLETERKDMLQSILEGIAMRSAEVIYAMDKVRPIGDTISVDGGLSANLYFKQFLASLIQKRIVTPANREITAPGCRFAGSQGLRQHPPMNVRTQHVTTEPAERDLSPYFANIRTLFPVPATCAANK